MLNNKVLELFLRYWLSILFIERITRLMFFSTFELDYKFSIINAACAIFLLCCIKYPTRFILLTATFCLHYISIINIDLANNFFRTSIIPFYSHWYLATTINMIILYYVARKKTESIVPAVKYIIAISLFFAGFAKFNTAFLNPNISCSTAVLDGIIYNFPILSFTRYFKDYFPFFTIAAEVSSPILLIFSRTRITGALLAWPLFFGLGLVLWPKFLIDFAGLYLASFILLLPQKSILKFIDLFNIRLKLNFSSRAILMFLIGLTLSYIEIANHKLLLNFIVTVFWIIFSISILVMILISLSDQYRISAAYNSDNSAYGINTSLGGFAKFLIAILIFKESLLYLGVPHQSNFNMGSLLSFSRLYSNHLFIPIPPDLGFNRIATITDSNDTVLGINKYYPWYSVEVYLGANLGKQVYGNVEGHNFSGSKPTGLLSWISHIFGVPLIVPQQINQTDIGCGKHY